MYIGAPARLYCKTSLRRGKKEKKENIGTCPVNFKQRDFNTGHLSIIFFSFFWTPVYLSTTAFDAEILQKIGGENFEKYVCFQQQQQKNSMLRLYI